jgi:hypothetical protein
VFLGTLDNHGLYFCPQSGMPTVIAQYGEEEHEYKSGMVFSYGQDFHLTQARLRAEQRKLI